jgi:hypothetical protein
MRLIHYMGELGRYRGTHVAPCGAVLISGDPGQIHPATELLPGVTCPECRYAVRHAAKAYARCLRLKTVGKDWGDEPPRKGGA